MSANCITLRCKLLQLGAGLVFLLGAGASVAGAPPHITPDPAPPHIVPERLVNAIGNAWNDPLRTRPPLLDTRKILPGDTNMAPCSAAAVGPIGSIGNAPLNLGAAVDLALCHNPQVQTAWAGIKVQAGALGEARAAWLPTSSMSMSRLNDHTSYPGSSSDSTTLTSTTLNGSLNWRLFDFGARAANRGSVTALLGAALANHDAAVQKVLSSVVQAYFDAQTAQAVWQARVTTQALSQRMLETTQRRESRGLGAQSDTLQAATALAKAVLDRNRAQGANVKALAVLVYVLGAPAGTDLTLAPLVEALAEPEQDLRQDLKAWLAQAQATHPALLAARAQLLSLREKVTATRADGLPSIDFSANFYQNGRPNQGLTPGKSNETVAGLTLTIPLFEGFSRTYKVRGAQAQVEQQEAQLQDTENQVLMEVVKAHADASAALDNLAASQSLQDAAQRALASVQRKFDKGAADISDIINTQSALADAQQQRISCLAEWRSARLRLLANAGTMDRRDIQELDRHQN